MGSRTKASGNPQPSGWPKYNEKLTKRLMELEQSKQEATESSLLECLRENAQTIAAEGIENLLEIDDEAPGSTKDRSAHRQLLDIGGSSSRGGSGGNGGSRGRGGPVPTTWATHDAADTADDAADPPDKKQRSDDCGDGRV